MKRVKNRRMYIFATLITGALLTVLCVLIFGNPDSGTNGFVVLTPQPLPTGSQSGNDGWGDWIDRPGDDTATTPAPSPTPVQTAAPTPAPTPEPASSSLRRGDKSQEVERMQQRLKYLGYYSGNLDGNFGGGTENAVKDFQKANGLTADGVAGRRTMDALYSDAAKRKPAASSGGNTAQATDKPSPQYYTASTPNATYGYLAPGNTGGKVTRLQNRLAELGYLLGDYSGGTYDEATEAAVRAFQKRNGQWVDGKAGPDTQTALYGSGALAAHRD